MSKPLPTSATRNIETRMESMIEASFIPFGYSGSGSSAGFVGGSLGCFSKSTLGTSSDVLVLGCFSTSTQGTSFDASMFGVEAIVANRNM